MSHETAPPTPLPATYQDFRRELFGLNQETQFEQAIEEQIAAEQGGQQEAATAALMAEHGIAEGTVNPRALSAVSELDSFTADDWDRLKTSETPLLSAYSSSYRIYQQQKVDENRAATGWGVKLRGPSSRLEAFEDQTCAASLPLIHGTSVTALASALQRGEFISNRALADEGVDVLDGVGNTTMKDRMLGLDKYVFADFARPHAYRRDDQAEVTVVLEPEALDQPGAFLTENDIADTTRVSGYMDGASLPEDFRASLLPRIYHTQSEQTYWSDRNNSVMNADLTISAFAQGTNGRPTAYGQVGFSTWEAKMPAVPTGHIRRLIFRDQSQYQEFTAEHGDQYDCVYEPNLSRYTTSAEDEANLQEYAQFKGNGTGPAPEPRHPDIFGNQARHRKEWQAAIDADYAYRVQLLEQADPADVKTAYISGSSLVDADERTAQEILKLPVWAMPFDNAPSSTTPEGLVNNIRRYGFYVAPQAAVVKIAHTGDPSTAVLQSYTIHDL